MGGAGAALSLVTSTIFFSIDAPAVAVSAFVVMPPTSSMVYRRARTHSPRFGTTKHHLSNAPGAFEGSDQMIDRANLMFDRIDRNGSGGIDAGELNEILASLDLEATPEESQALFTYLDLDGDGLISFEEFLPWYSDAAGAVKRISRDFQTLLCSRRTVNRFDKTPVSDDVLRRAIECAIAAPNRSGSEPWGFIKIGPATVEKLQMLNQKIVMAGGEQVINSQQKSPLLPEVWTEIPGWCAVTTRLNPDDPQKELSDFRSTSCAMQNFMLSMWSEGIGSKWTEGPTQKTQQFADLCGVDTTKERVAGIIWYGFTTGGLNQADPKKERKKGIDDVLTTLP